MKTQALSSVRLATVVHLYYLDLWSEISEVLFRLPSHTEIFITTTDNQIQAVRECVLADFPGAKIYGFPNRGRDLGPLLELMKVQRLEDFDLVLKIHSKKSVHLQSKGKDLGQFWRRKLLNQLIPSWGIADVIGFFDRQPHVGMAGPAEYLLPVSTAFYNQGTVRWFERLLQKLGRPVNSDLESFFAGTMFWARGQVFGALGSLGLHQTDNETEFGQTDGTLAHALERMFPLLARSVGLQAKAFPVWDFRSWLQARLPQPAQAVMIRDYLQTHGGGPQILMVVVDRYDQPERVALTRSSLQATTAWGLNVRTLVLRDLSELRGALASDGADWFFMVDAGDELTSSGLLMVIQKILRSPAARAVYADEMKAFANGKLEPVMRPHFNLDLLLSCPGFMCRHWIFKTSAVREVGGITDRADAWFELDLILRLVEKEGFHDLLHVAEPLLIADPNQQVREGAESVILRHLHARNYPNARIDSELPGMYRIDYKQDLQPLVSILIVASDELLALTRCIESLLSTTVYPNYEIIIVDNKSQAPETIAWLESVSQWGGERIRVVRMTEKVSRAKAHNLLAIAARGEYLLTLSHKTIIKNGEWLQWMLNHAQRPEVAVVGPWLLHPQELLHYAGCVLGLRSVVSRPFVIKLLNSDINTCRFKVDQNYSALPDVCFLIKRTIFDELGGFDEIVFGDFYADIDFCLKAMSAGYINVWTPQAQVTHDGQLNHESLGKSSPQALSEMHEQQGESFYQKWRDLIAEDPAYNINYSLLTEGFSVEERKDGFANDHEPRWSPLSWRPLPVVYAQPADQFGCGHYRVIQPFKALKSAGLLEGVVENSLGMSIEAARLKPDVVVTQRLISEHAILEYRKMKRRQDFFMVVDFDDYFKVVPAKNEFRNRFSHKSINKGIREGLALADRFVVSTSGLAEAFEGFHRDIRVSELKLPPAWWQDLKLARNDGPKPRVGWAGGNLHAGDLELVGDVVKALANEVDWVFFGMCPESLLPWVKEFHTGVQIEFYPEKLASLNLDLAIAPLENNIFNDCKSNLRLLEFGACAYPVVCSDARTYRESGLPVTVVKNRFKDWVAAIRMHINDLDEAHRCGNALRQAVLSDWMLRDDALEKWRSNWIPD